MFCPAHCTTWEETKLETGDRKLWKYGIKEDLLVQQTKLWVPERRKRRCYQWAATAKVAIDTCKKQTGSPMSAMQKEPITR